MTHNSSQVQILLVEDDEDDFILIRSMLNDIPSCRYDLSWAATYESALEALDRQEWQVILLDYRLGAHDGLEVLRHAQDRHCRAPIIILTGLEAFTIDTAAMQAGASDYLVKGNLSAVFLERAIRYALERTKAEEALSASEALFHNLYQEAPIGVELYDQAGRLIAANPACLSIFGVDQFADVQGFSLFDDPNVSDEIKQRLLAGAACTYDAVFDFDKVKAAGLYPTRRSGLIQLFVQIKSLSGAGNMQAGYMALVQDITERTLAQEELARHRDHLEELVRSRTESLEVEIAQRERIAIEMNNKTEALESLNRVMMARERRVIELKEEVNRLCRELARPDAYPPIWVQTS